MDPLFFCVVETGFHKILLILYQKIVMVFFSYFYIIFMDNRQRLFQKQSEISFSLCNISIFSRVLSTITTHNAHCKNKILQGLVPPHMPLFRHGLGNYSQQMDAPPFSWRLLPAKRQFFLPTVAKASAYRGSYECWGLLYFHCIILGSYKYIKLN